MKTRQDNDMNDRTSAVYAKSETKLSWSIGLAPSESNSKVDWTSHYRESTELQYPI